MWGFPGTYFRYLGTGDRDVTDHIFICSPKKPKKKGSCADKSGDFISSTYFLFSPSLTLGLTATRRLKRPKLKMEERLGANDVKQTTSRVIQLIQIIRVRVSEFN